jgi:hypothetical protein
LYFLARLTLGCISLQDCLLLPKTVLELIGNNDEVGICPKPLRFFGFAGNFEKLPKANWLMMSAVLMKDESNIATHSVLVFLPFHTGHSHKASGVLRRQSFCEQVERNRPSQVVTVPQLFSYLMIIMPLDVTLFSFLCFRK